MRCKLKFMTKEIDGTNKSTLAAIWFYDDMEYGIHMKYDTETGYDDAKIEISAACEEIQDMQYNV